MFNSRLLKEKDLRIAELKEQIIALHFSHARECENLERRVEDLKKLVFSPTSANYIPLNQLESDAVLSGKDTVLHVPAHTLSADEQKELADAESEAMRIFAGTY